MPKFKVGDRVVAVDSSWHNAPNGDTGTVLHVDHMVTVNLDRDLGEYGHSGEEYGGQDGHVWHFWPKELKKIEDTADAT